MELKAIKEYKNPEYPTAEESKNRILMMMVRSGTLSLGVAIMCMLCNYSSAQFHEIGGDIGVVDNIGGGIYEILRKGFFFGAILTSLFVIVFYCKYNKKYKISTTEEEQSRLKRLKNRILFIGLFIMLINILCISVLNLLAVPPVGGITMEL